MGASDTEITPWPIPEAERGRGVLLVGGTFDPPHRWHIEAARAARDFAHGPTGWVVFVPAARSPFKAEGPLAADEDRIQMLRAAAGEMERAAVWTDEIDRSKVSGGASYTIDTVRRAMAAGSGPVRLLVGSDQAAAFHRWRSGAELFDLARPVVAPRPPLDSGAALETELRASGAWSEAQIADWLSSIVPMKTSPISSTRVRELLAGSTNAAAERELESALPGPVLRIIRERRLYRGQRGSRT